VERRLPLTAHTKPTTLTVRRGAAAVQDLEVMRLTENAVLMQCELLPGAELPLAGVAGETGQVVHVVPGLAHPVARRDATAALGALGPKTSATNKMLLKMLSSGI
jgi:hypothetical protein